MTHLTVLAYGVALRALLVVATLWACVWAGVL